MKDETFCSLSHFGSCTYGTAVQHAVSQGPHSPLTQHSLIGGVRHGPHHHVQRHLSLPMNPGEWASLDKTTWCKLLLTMVQCGQC